MKILIIDNQFNGAYGSLKKFVIEIAYEFRKMGHTVYLTKEMSEAIAIYQLKTIDFSLGLGKYNYYSDGRALYDIYKIMHYQWIIDNPYKMQIDVNSKFIKYIMIDKMFEKCVLPVQNRILIQPLGVADDIVRREETSNRIRGIVFSGQIKNVNDIYADISVHRFKKKIIQVIDSVMEHLDVPYITVFNERMKAWVDDNKREVFRLSNSYIRAYKRTRVITQIKQYPIYLIGEVHNKEITTKANVTLVGSVKYERVFDRMREYMFSLNIEPNFNTGFHDRALRTVLNGNILITNLGSEQEKFYGRNAIYYKYTDIDEIERNINQWQENDIVHSRKVLEKKVRKYFGWDVVLGRIIKEFKEKRNG